MKKLKKNKPSKVMCMMTRHPKRPGAMVKKPKSQILKYQGTVQSLLTEKFSMAESFFSSLR